MTAPGTLTLRWGIVGTGLHVEQRILPAIRRAQSARLVGIAGSSPERGRAFAERTGIGRAYPSLEALLADPDVDAVFISTPNHLHRAQAILAAAAGKHVLVEKPMALTVADCQAMIDACRAAGVKLGVGFQQRQHPVHREIRRLIADGELGQIIAARGEWFTSYGPWTNWRARPELGGSDILNASGVHVLDLLAFLIGSDVRDVSAAVDISSETGQDQTIAAWLRYANGVTATVMMTRLAFSPLNSVEVWGTNGTATGVGSLGMAPTGRLRRTRGREISEIEMPVPDLFVEQFDAFAKAVERDIEPSASGLEGLKSVALSERILEGKKIQTKSD